MYQQQQLIKMMEYERHRYEEKIQQLEYEAALAPKGYLELHRNSYYHVIYKKGYRVQRKLLACQGPDVKIIYQLKEKGHIKKALPILKNNMNACEAFLNRCRIYDICEIKETMPAAYSDFDYSPIMLEGDVYPEEWEIGGRPLTNAQVAECIDSYFRQPVD